MSKLAQAIECAKSGDKAKARQLLAEVIQAEPNNESAWLWMSSVVGGTDQQVYCLKQVLRINPNSQPASMGLSKLTALKNQLNVQVRQNLKAENPVETNSVPESPYRAQPVPDISKWSNGFTGWSILDKVIKTNGASPELGILIAESGVAKNRILGWAALFLLLAALFGFLTALNFGDPLILLGIAFIFLIAALYRTATWYLNKDLKAEVFREGFTFRKAGKTQVVFWREIDYVKEKWEKMIYQGIIHINKHKVEIHKTDGQKLEMDRSLEKIEAIGRLIQRAVADHLLAAKVEQLKNNQDCDFGVFTISRFGIKHKNKFLPWEDIKALEVYTTGQTTVKVQKTDSKLGLSWAMENGGAIKNLYLFLDLSYWFIKAARLPVTDQVDTFVASQETDNGDVYYKLPVTKIEARDGTQKTLYVGTSLHEKQLIVKVPAGVQSGTIYRFPDYGRSRSGNGTAGTLTVEIVVEKVTPLQKKLEEIQIACGIILLMAGMMWLSMWSSLDLISSIILAILIGGVGGVLISIRQRVLGAVSGAIGGAICFILQVVYYEFMYFAFGRESFWNYEMVIVLLLSALPGFGLYALLTKLIKKKQASFNL